LADAERVFPVTIDPLFYHAMSGSPGCASTVRTTPTDQCDVYVNSDALNGAYHLQTELRMGSNARQEHDGSGLARTRTFIKFPLDSSVFNSNNVVKSAEVRMDAFQAETDSSNPRYYDLYAAASSPYTNTRWADHPNRSGGLLTWDRRGGTGTYYWRDSTNLNNLVQGWFNGSVNNGLRFEALQEREIASLRRFRSGDSGMSTAPRLLVWYVVAPHAPWNVAASAATGTVTGTWTHTSYWGDEDAAHRYYDVRLFTSSGSAVTSWVALAGTATTHTFTGLSPNVSYYYTIRSRNRSGTSMVLQSPTVTTPIVAPSAPASASASAGNRQVSGSWTAPSSWGGAPSAERKYEVQLMHSSGTSAASAVTVSSSTTSRTWTGLNGNASYYVRVRAGNSAGWSSWRSSATVTTPVATPGLPGSVSAAAGPGSATVTWTAPSDTGGATITGYTIRTFNADGTSGGPNRTVCGTCLSDVVPNLTTGKSYYFTVAAINSAGTGAARTSNTVTIPSGPPGTPRDIVATVTGGHVTVTWNAPADDGGSPVTSYTIRPRNVTAGTLGVATVLSCSSPCRSYRFTRLAKNAVHEFEVSATNGFGTGPVGTSNRVTTPGNWAPDTPTAPTPAAGTELDAAPGVLATTYVDPDGDAGTVRYTVRSLDSNAEVFTVTSAMTASGGRASYTGPLLERLWTGRYEVSAVAIDTLGQSSVALVWTFRVADVSASLGYDGYAPWAGGVNTAIANLLHSETDATIASAGPELVLERFYNSRAIPASAEQRAALRHVGFGPGWTHSFSTRAVSDWQGNVAIDWADGRREVHRRTATGSFTRPEGFYSTLASAAGGGHTLTLTDRTVYTFAVDGSLRSIADHNGRRLTLTYEQGNLHQVLDDASGRALTFTWQDGRIRSVATPPVAAHGGALTWAYDYQPDGTLEESCSPRDASEGIGCTTYLYANARLTTVTRPEGNVDVRVRYHGDGRLDWRENGAGDRLTYDYDAAEPKVTVTDGRGEVTEQSYDAKGRQVAETLYQHLAGPGGDVDRVAVTTTYAYEGANGERTAITDGNGHTSGLVYDANGNVTRLVNGLGETVYSTYTGDGLLEETRDGRSTDATDPRYVTRYAYQGRNKISETTPATADHPAGVTRRFEYSTAVTPAIGGATTPAGLLVAEVDARGNRTTHAYDANGDLRRSVDRAGVVTDYSYDELGRKLTETVTGDAQAAVVTAWTYDADGNVRTVTDPSAVNPVTGVRRQLRTTSDYDANANLTVQTLADINAPAGGREQRVTRYEWDAADREAVVVDAEGGRLGRTFDAAGNIRRVTDAEGRVYETTYDPRNLPETVTLRGFVDDPVAGGAARDLVVSRLTYDAAGRKRTETDAEGRRREWLYDPADRLLTVTLLDYADPDGTGRPFVEQAYTYDGAGNVRTEAAGNRSAVTRHTYDDAGWLTATVFDEAGVDRVVSYTRDANANATVEQRTGAGSPGVTEEIRRTFDAADRMTVETVENGVEDLTTRYGYDARGNLIGRTDPRGATAGADPVAFTTTWTHDELDRVITEQLPPVELAGATTSRPAVASGYDTFGNATHRRDARGNVTVTGYDALDREVRIAHPSYIRPSDGQLLNAVETFAYDAVGNTVAQTSRRGHTTEWTFDQRNRAVRQLDPPVSGSSARGTTRFVYDDAGNLRRRTDQVGAVTEWTHDALDRVRTETAVVRRGSGQPDRYTTRLVHDDLGNVTSTTTPTGATSTAVHNAAGEQTSATDASGRTSVFTYDLAGRLLDATDPLGRRTSATYDLAGRPIATRRYDTTGTLLSTATNGYDPAGNQTTSTSPRGHEPGAEAEAFTTRTTYNAANWLTATSTPTAATRRIATGYGYDAAGNPTAVTDGRGNTTQTTYNPWNLVEDRIEPATAAHPALAERTYTTGYDAGGLAVTDTQPGGITITRSFDALARLRAENGSGGGASTPAATRSFDYDLAGRRTAASHPAGTITFTHDDRHLLTATNGPAGSSAFGYDAAGRMTSRSDAAGTATYTWTARDELATATDPLTQTTREWTFDPAGQPDAVTYAGGAERDYAYDDLGRLTQDTLTNTDGQVTLAHGYGYDTDGNVTSQTVTATGNTAAGEHTYTHDHAGRLTRWSAPAAGLPLVTDYAYDDAHNRTGAGAATYTYDERNRLATGPAGGYTWTPRGTMASSTDTTTAATYTFDALGRQVVRNGVATSYDALDRIATRTQPGQVAGTSVSRTFAYAGAELDPAHDGDTIATTPLGTTQLTEGSSYARSPAGRVLALHKPGATDTLEPTLGGLGVPGKGRIAHLNRHGDLTGLHTPSGHVSDTTVWDPYGNTAAATGATLPDIGYQADWTDPTSGEVWMGARHYQPANAAFTARDTVHGELTTPVTLNRHTYANANPLGYFDPDGRTAAQIDGRAGGRTYASSDPPASVKERAARREQRLGAALHASKGRRYEARANPVHPSPLTGYFEFGNTRPSTAEEGRQDAILEILRRSGLDGALLSLATKRSHQARVRGLIRTGGSLGGLADAVGSSPRLLRVTPSGRTTVRDGWQGTRASGDASTTTLSGTSRPPGDYDSNSSRPVSDAARSAWSAMRFNLNLAPTAASALYAIAHGGSCSVAERGIIVCVEVGRQRYWGSGTFQVGNTTITDRADLGSSLRRHEERHADQWALLGPAFVPLYIGAYGVSELIHGDQTGNPFEMHAGLEDGCYVPAPHC
jgi:RHS repeat-associated protein